MIDFQTFNEAIAPRPGLPGTSPATAESVADYFARARTHALAVAEDHTNAAAAMLQAGDQDGAREAIANARDFLDLAYTLALPQQA